MLTRDPEKRPSAAKLLEDKLILQVMINNSSQVNLKKEYSMGLEKPLLS